jgi:hypothetical protein
MGAADIACAQIRDCNFPFEVDSANFLPVEEGKKEKKEKPVAILPKKSNGCPGQSEHACLMTQDLEKSPLSGIVYYLLRFGSHALAFARKCLNY